VAANLIAAATLLLLVPAVWLALRLKDHFLGGTPAAGTQRRHAVALLIREASTEARPAARNRRTHAFRRRTGVRHSLSSPSPKSSSKQTGVAEIRTEKNRGR